MYLPYCQVYYVAWMFAQAKHCAMYSFLEGQNNVKGLIKQRTGYKSSSQKKKNENDNKQTRTNANILWMVIDLIQPMFALKRRGD